MTDLYGALVVDYLNQLADLMSSVRDEFAAAQRDLDAARTRREAEAAGLGTFRAAAAVDICNSVHCQLNNLVRVLYDGGRVIPGVGEPPGGHGGGGPDDDDEDDGPGRGGGPDDSGSPVPCPPGAPPAAGVE